MNKYCVYMHTSPSGKRYIGITSMNPERRWRKGKGYTKEQNAFYNAIVKYGWDNIKHEILFDGLTKDEACAKEIEVIAFYNSNHPQYGYNISNGGDGAKAITESMRENMRKSHLGKKMDETTKQKIGQSNREYWKTHKKICTKEDSRKCWESRRANGNTTPWNKGKHTGGKPVLQYSKDGVFIKRYNSAKEATTELNIDGGHISECCRGKRKSIGGFIWKYAQE